MKRILSLLAVLVFAVIGADQAEACVSQNAQIAISGDLNADLNDWAMIFQDASTAGCESQAKSQLSQKLTAQNNVGAWSGFLRGGAVALASATGLILEGKYPGTPDAEMQNIDRLLAMIPYYAEISSNCGFVGTTPGGFPQWTRGDSCMDDYAVAAEGYAWRAAFLRKTGRADWRFNRLYAINNIIASFDTTKSICIYDESGVMGTNGPCNSTPAAFANGQAVVLPINHGQENPSYGIGLVSTLASAFLGLEVAEDPVVPSVDFGAQYGDINLMMRGLFEEGQHGSASATTFASACHRASGTPDPSAPSFPSLSVSDMQPANRNRSCQDQFFAYKPGMYPVSSFYTRYSFPKGSQPGFGFDGASFPHTDFTPNLGDRTAFFGAGRKAIYYTLGYDWMANGIPVTLEGNGVYTMAILTYGNRYVSALNNGGSSVNATPYYATGPETFTLTTPNLRSLRNAQDVTMKTSSNWFLSAQNGGGAALRADKISAGPWETFRILKISDVGGRPGTLITDGDKIAFQSRSTGTTWYMRAVSGGGGAVNVDRTTRANDETFTYVKRDIIF